MTAPERGKAKRHCDECGRNARKIARVHRGERFCGNCYTRMFKRRMCPQCGNFARLPRFEPDALCLKCESARPCTRCGRTEYRTGLRTPYGPACVACAPYFKTAEPCDGCGTPSRWLSRRTDLENDLRICPRCARADHGTCNACRRSRPLAETADGRKLCRLCAEQGEIPCPECECPMPAGCGKRCWDCYWKQVTECRIELNAAGVVSPALSQRFRAFGAWLIEERGPHQAALKINRHLEFFQEIDRRWNDIPGYEALLKHFGADGLRRYRLAMRWMKAAGLVIVDVGAREADSDRRRIEATLDRVKECSTQAADILSGYHATLRERAAAGKCTLRSMRMALSPAARLLETAAEAQTLPPDQRLLDAFLRRAPGQQAAVSGFVTLCRKLWSSPHGRTCGTCCTGCWTRAACASEAS